MSESENSNIFEVISAQPTSTDEVIVTGTVTEGTVRKGSWAAFESTNEMPVTAQIIRIGTADTPLNLIRQGTQ